MQRSENNSNELDKVVEQEIQRTGCNIVRIAARLANERIHESSIRFPKRKASTSDEDDFEVDNICVDSEGVSVGTKIKREAVRLFQQYYDLSCEEKAVVGLGLNSILDLTSSSAQKRLLINNWNNLRGLFGQQFKPGIKIDGKLERRISKIEEVSKEDLEKGRFTCYRKEINSKGKVHADIFSIYSQYLELMEFHSYVFEKTIDITESDVVVKMWSPLIERLFRRVELRTKWGDTMGESADIENRTTGLKVDLRFLKDTLSRRRKEADKANCEVSKLGAGHIKITSDRTKLLIESKVILDHLIKEEPEKVKEIAVPALQLIGNRAILYSINLTTNGLYVAVKEGTAVIPNHISHIKDFREVIMLLFKFKNATTDVMAFGLDSENNNSNSSNSNSTSWVRESWIPPNTEKKKRLPDIPGLLFFNK